MNKQMNKEEIKQYLKQNLKIDWKYEGYGKLYVVLTLEGEVISKIPFAHGDAVLQGRFLNVRL